MEKKFLDKQGLMVLNEGLGTKFVSQASEKTMLKELQDDISHRTVTDEEKDRWNQVDNKVDKTVLKSYAKKTEVVTSVNGKKGDMMVDFFIGDDTRRLNYVPKDYLECGTRYKSCTNSQFEFKRCPYVEVDHLIAQDYCIVNTQVTWADKSGGLPMQIAYGKGVMAIRNAVDENTWGEWQKVSTADDLSGYATKADLSKIDVTSQLLDYVKKVEGKGLSTNDYTNEDKTKLQAMPVPVFLEKEQYASLSEKEKIDNNKIYYIYAGK